MEKAQQAIKATVQALFGLDLAVEVNRPEPQFGDYTTNVALKIAKQLSQSPKEIATKITAHLQAAQLDWLAKVEVAGPGFINLTVNDKVVIASLENILECGDSYGTAKNLTGQNIIVEYLDPNPMKEIHIGHAYSGTIGDAIASLLEAAGASVHRVTYQGDVGLHVAKAMYGILNRIDNTPAKLTEITPSERPRFLGETYALGAQAYDADEAAKYQIIELNKKIYDLSDPIINEVYETSRAWSLEYFDEVYALYGFTPFEKNYMEGAVSAEGLALVHDHIEDEIFTESEGAIIFVGEQYGLHTRVFINSLGLPTYEAKDLGNAMLKWRDYNYDRSIIITAEEQTEYFKVMLKALEQFAPEQAIRTTHIAHGLVRLSTGKMASRSGQVVRAMDLLKAAEDAARAFSDDIKTPVHRIALAAIKYGFLKNRIGGDIIYDINESVSLEGNSGPYLQYAYARAHSILDKSVVQPSLPADLTTDERLLSAELGEFEDVMKTAIEQLTPHVICTYLYDLAQQFNRFYERNRIIGDPREAVRLSLVKAYATVLKNGLTVLKIPAPERM